MSCSLPALEYMLLSLEHRFSVAGAEVGKQALFSMVCVWVWVWVKAWESTAPEQALEDLRVWGLVLM